MTEAEFDTAADEELRALDDVLADFDPDEVDVELSQGVLTLTFDDDDKLIINSHRAAGQIWMAAFRTAWHFSPRAEGPRIVWRTDKDELRATLARVLGERLKRSVTI